MSFLPQILIRLFIQIHQINPTSNPSIASRNSTLTPPINRHRQSFRYWRHPKKKPSAVLCVPSGLMEPQWTLRDAKKKVWGLQRRRSAPPRNDELQSLYHHIPEIDLRPFRLQ